MADPEVKIKVTANTKQAQSALSSLNKSWIGVNSALDLGKKAAQFLGDAYNALVGDTQEYAQAVLKMTRISGQSAEMTSRMIELTDDFGIAQETLAVAMRGATTKGIAFTVDNLAAMSDEYLNLKPGIEQAQYAAEKFGARAGAEMQKLLEKGSKAIREQSAAIDEHMLVTDEDLKSSEQLRIAQDNLNDSVTAVGREIGKTLIPALADAADAAYLLMTRHQKLIDVLNQHNGEVQANTTNYEDYKAEMIRAANAAGLLVKENNGLIQVERQVTNNKRVLITDFRILSQAEYENADAIAEADRRLMQWGGTIRTTSQTDMPNATAAADAMGAQYTAMAEKHKADTAAMAAELRGQLLEAYKEVQAQNVAWAKGAGGDIAGMLDQADLSAGDYNQALIALDSAMGTNLYTAKLQNDAMQKIVDQYKKTGDVDQFKDSLLRLKNGGFQPMTDSIITARVQLEELIAKMRELDGQTATGYVNIISGSGGATMTAPKYDSMGAGDTSYVPENVYIPHRAGGGDVRGGSPYIVGENGPEMFVPGQSGAIVPNDKLGNITMNFYGPTSPAAVESAVRRTMKSYGHQYQGG